MYQHYSDWSEIPLVAKDLQYNMKGVLVIFVLFYTVNLVTKTILFDSGSLKKEWYRVIILICILFMTMLLFFFLCNKLMLEILCIFNILFCNVIGVSNMFHTIYNTVVTRTGLLIIWIISWLYHNLSSTYQSQHILIGSFIQLSGILRGVTHLEGTSEVSHSLTFPLFYSSKKHLFLKYVTVERIECF